jgi:hypothetical protein
VIEAVNQVVAKRVVNRAANPAMTGKAAAKKQVAVEVRKVVAVHRVVALAAAIDNRETALRDSRGGFQGARPCYQWRNRRSIRRIKSKQERNHECFCIAKSRP